LERRKITASRGIASDKRAKLREVTIEEAQTRVSGKWWERAVGSQ
jgi:hypothetical protein